MLARQKIGFKQLELGGTSYNLSWPEQNIMPEKNSEVTVRASNPKLYLLHASVHIAVQPSRSGYSSPCDFKLGRKVAAKPVAPAALQSNTLIRLAAIITTRWTGERVSVCTGYFF